MGTRVATRAKAKDKEKEGQQVRKEKLPGGRRARRILRKKDVEDGAVSQQNSITAEVTQGWLQPCLSAELFNTI